MKSEYQNVYNTIKTPEEWKENIKMMMKQEMEAEQKTIEERKTKGGQKSIWRPVIGVAVAAMLCLTVGIGHNWKQSITTPSETEAMQLASRYPDVHFVDRGETLDVGVTFGAHEDETTGEKITSYEEASGKDITVFQYTNQNLSEESESDVSIIHGEKVLIEETKDGTDFIYTASFMRGENLIKVVGKNVEKLDFLDIVYQEMTE